MRFGILFSHIIAFIFIVDVVCLVVLVIIIRLYKFYLNIGFMFFVRIILCAVRSNLYT